MPLQARHLQCVNAYMKFISHLAVSGSSWFVTRNQQQGRCSVHPVQDLWAASHHSPRERQRQAGHHFCGWGAQDKPGRQRSLLLISSCSHLLVHLQMWRHHQKLDCKWQNLQNSRNCSQCPAGMQVTCLCWQWRTPQGSHEASHLYNDGWFFGVNSTTNSSIFDMAKQSLEVCVPMVLRIHFVSFDCYFSTEHWLKINWHVFWERLRVVLELWVKSSW